MYESARLERAIYGAGVNPHKYTTECLSVLKRTFKSIFFEEPLSVQHAIECIRDGTQHEVLEVLRLQDPMRFSMNKHFKRLYKIQDTRWVYHGTTKTKADIIAKVGFRNSASQRAKFGKGIYAAKNVWEALAYAEPDAISLNQTFFVVEFAQGPSCVGTENMTDFGVDDEQRQILTTTNPEETVLCAAYEDQLYAHYKIIVRCSVEKGLLPSTQSIVRMYHPFIWTRLKQTSASKLAPGAPAFALPAPAPAPAPAPKPRAIPQATKIQCHHKFKVGDPVKIIKTWQKYEFAQNAVGTIEQIVKDGKVHFFVMLHQAGLRELVCFSNKGPLLSWHTNPSWLRCQLCHLEPVSAAAPGSVAQGAASSSAAPAAAHATTSGDLSGAGAGNKRRRM
jgi:hypothetical protein